ncbi:helix-turn-helix domain-containing protein [Nocardia sp. NPDC046763]|uniref:helix-turn-helix domain-containing protein n=1 Tax=Nocardia sp. NPDC046763 TaxID=3155256 RepID=UPI0033DF978A
MGRNEKPITDTGPIGKFATALRKLRGDAGLTYREMEAMVFVRRSTLAQAANGRDFPTWEVTAAYITACGVDEDSKVQQWRGFWDETQLASTRLLCKVGEAVMTVGGTATVAGPAGRGKLRPVTPDLAEPGQWHPRPDTVQTFDDLRLELNRLKLAIGNPGLRPLCRGMAVGGHDCYSVTALSDVFNGNRVPNNLTLYRRLVHVMLAEATKIYRDHGGDLPWRSAQSWTDAWVLAEYNRSRPDLRVRRRFGDIYLVVEDQDEGPAAAIFEAMDTDKAAALLSSLAPQIAQEIIIGLSPKKTHAVVTSIQRMHRRAAPQAPTAQSDAGEQGTDGAMLTVVSEGA